VLPATVLLCRTQVGPELDSIHLIIQ